MKVGKTIGIIFNIVLTFIYAGCSWLFSFFGLMLLTNIHIPEEGMTVGGILLMVCGVLLLCTILFCVIGIFASVILRKKEQYLKSFVIQFLPFFTLLIAMVLFLLSIFLGDTKFI